VTEPERTFKSARRITYYALLTAIAIVLSAAESLIPVPAPAPGIKLGLANIITLILLMEDRSPAYALAVTVARCVIAALAFGALSTLLFSLAGGVVSCIVMWFLLRLNFIFSTVGVSVAGALAHNVTQLAAASALARDPAVFGYLPVLLVAGVAAGCATGFVAGRLSVIFKINRI
jgi:heptaprenyl diphosphate synthase